VNLFLPLILALANYKLGITLKLCVELGEDLISLVCLVLNVIALVRCRSVETWMPLNVGWLGYL
jgi:hypothetical protein